MLLTKFACSVISPVSQPHVLQIARETGKHSPSAGHSVAVSALLNSTGQLFNLLCSPDYFEVVIFIPGIMLASCAHEEFWFCSVPSDWQIRAQAAVFSMLRLLRLHSVGVREK